MAEVTHVMNRNVMHNGKDYKKGSACPDQHKEEFVKSGFADKYEAPKPLEAPKPAAK